jgi:hypothetical protein
LNTVTRLPRAVNAPPNSRRLPRTPGHKPGATRIAVGGFKHPEEVKVFASIGEFRLLAVDIADRDTRIGRGVQSGRVAQELEEAGASSAGAEIERFAATIDDRDLNGRPETKTTGSRSPESSGASRKRIASPTMGTSGAVRGAGRASSPR